MSSERISAYEVIENLVEQGRYCLTSSNKFSMTLYCLSCFYANEVIDVTIATTDLSNILPSPMAECHPDDVTLTSA